MTGPGPGKIPLDANVLFCSKNKCIEVSCEVYLHVKGWSLARVTHLDIECPVMNELLAPKRHMYLLLVIKDDELRLKLRNPVYVKPLGLLVREIRVVYGELANSLGNGRTWVYVGGKAGGIFLGFKKEYVEKLEALAASKGVAPLSKR